MKHPIDMTTEEILAERAAIYEKMAPLEDRLHELYEEEWRRAAQAYLNTPEAKEAYRKWQEYKAELPPVNGPEDDVP